MSKRHNKKYSKELKLQAIQEYQSGKGSLAEICRKHGIVNDKQLRNWIKCKRPIKQHPRRQKEETV